MERRLVLHCILQTMSNLLSLKEKNHIKSLYVKRLIVTFFVSFTILAIFGTISFLPSYIYSKKEEKVLLAKKAYFDSQETGELKQSLISTI